MSNCMVCPTCKRRLIVRGEDKKRKRDEARAHAAVLALKGFVANPDKFRSRTYPDNLGAVVGAAYMEIKRLLDAFDTEDGLKKIYRRNER